MSQKYSFLTGDDMYSIRCGVVHNGRCGDLKHNVARVLFALPGPGTLVNCQMNDAYVYGVVEFCKDFIAIVRKWYRDNESNTYVQANVPRLVQFRPMGLAPYVVGMPLIG